MRFEKTIVHRLGMPYALGVMRRSPGPQGASAPAVVCATEDHGPVVATDPPYRTARTLAAGPGGCMALVADPDRPSDLYAVMGCFIGYHFQGGGIYRIRNAEPVERLLDLPFAHRIGFATRGGRRYLLAANLAADKKDAADWSQAGTLYAAELGEEAGSPMNLQPVLPGLHKNHGFLLTRLEGRSTLLIGAAEGLLSVDLDLPGVGWDARQVLPGEVSEVAVADLDGDGQEELVTIEPFHGNTLRAYHRSPGGWTLFWEAEVAFGHCVLAGAFQGRASVLVSNRSGSRDLLLFQFGGTPPLKPRRIVVEEGAAAANMLVLPWEGKDVIFSANQAEGALVMYTPRESAAP